MLGRNSGQVDIFNSMIFEKLIPKNHLLVKIESVIDFSFVYDKEEVTADKVYGSIDNSAYLKDINITANIDFYEESSREVKCYRIKDFIVSEDLKSAPCPFLDIF